jgi:glycosidase
VETLGVVVDSSVKYLANGQFASFLTNHDQDRLMNQVYKEPAKVKTAASLLLLLPGVPFIYYGEEIGMTGAKPDEKIRTPMQWSRAEYAGFSSRFPWQVVNSEYQDGINVADQQTDPNSMWVHYRALIHLRNTHAALRVGNYREVKVAGERLEIFAFVRQSAQETVLVLVNLSKNPAQNFTLSMPRGGLSGEYDVFPLLGLPDGTALPALTASAEGGFAEYAALPEIPANGTLVLQLVSK